MGEGEVSKSLVARLTLMPFIVGFFTFWVWLVTDFPLSDKLLISTIALSIECALAFGTPE